jgi:GT2 family glycosyltransferase
MKWSAVITTYNSRQVIGRALESLYALSPAEKPVDIVVVDNASSDDTVSVINSCDVSVTTVLNSRNLGLSKANNLGAAAAEGDCLLFMNPDVEVLPGAVTAIYKLQEKHPEAAIIGPAMIDEDGVRQPTARTWPGLPVIAARRTILGKTRWGRQISSDHLNRFHNISGPSTPHWLVGAAMWLTPAGRKRVGLMSEKYFLYFEDVEWCWRAWSRGMEVWYEPEAVIRHVCRRESASGGRTLMYHLCSMFRFTTTHPSLFLGRGPGGTG